MRIPVCLLGLIALSSPNLIYAAVPNSVLLNEANTVSGDSFLDAGNQDSTYGRLQGNGQNWFELLVVQGDDLGGGSFSNTLDMRGWKLEWSYFDTADKNGSGVITFTNDPLWAAVPRGTLVTVSEWQQSWYLTNTPTGIDPNNMGGLQHKGGINGLGNQRGDVYNPAIHTLLDMKTDTTWNPAVNDWHINVYGGERNPDTSFKYFAFTGTVTEPDGDDPDSLPDVFTVGVDNDAGIFAVNNDAWQMTIKDSAGNIIQGPLGEAAPGWAAGGINSREILKIESFATGTNPTQASYLATTPGVYDDGSSSSFGRANIFGGNSVEDLSPLQNWWSPLHTGDFDGDGDVDGADFIVWQTNYPVQTVQHLPLGDGSTDGADFHDWQSNFPYGPSSGTAPVPEPAAIVLALTPALVLAWRFNRRKLIA